MRLILIGGFLGAGKTTLLREAAQRLAAQGKAVGLITNDQAPDLVDTALLSGGAAQVREVAGSCFCCNFNGFEAAVRSLVEAGADIVIAEPVGSCTDLSATIAQPLKEQFPQYKLAPLTVLLDPVRADELFTAETPLLHPDAAYIARLQLAEADRILLTKADTLDEARRAALLARLREEFLAIPVDLFSSHTGEGFDAWLAAMDSGRAGQRIVAVDYDRYANGEAVLGWLNARLDLRWIDGLEPAWADFATDLVARLHTAFRESESEIGHLKLLLEPPDGAITANLTGLGHIPRIQHSGGLARLSATLTLNARVQTTPNALEQTVREALAAAAHGRIACTWRTFHCFQPGRPVPTYRYAAVG